MPNRFEILNSIESIFLKIQDKITKINPGSVLRSIFYSVSTEIESLYQELSELKENSYIATARGEYLDNLIYGISGLRREQGKRAIGYVVLQTADFVFDSIESIDNFRFVFPYLNIEENRLTVYPNTPILSISGSTGTNNDYVLLPPLSLYPYNEEDFVFVEGEQPISKLYKGYIKRELLKTGKPIKYLILPIISVDVGENKNLRASTINDFISFGGSRLFVTNDVSTVADLSVAWVVDIDYAVSIDPDNNMLSLGENAFVRGGTDRESDEEYRRRFILYINSLSKGTRDSIILGIRPYIPEGDFIVTESQIPGVINIFINSANIYNDAVSRSIEFALEQFKPAGTVVNIFRAKPFYFNVLFDLESDKSLDTSALEVLKNNLYQQIRNRVSKINLDKIDKNEVSSVIVQNISSENYYRGIDNFYLGISLTEEVYLKYQTTMSLVSELLLLGNDYQEVFIDGQRVLVPNNLRSYAQYINLLKNGEFYLFVLEKTSSGSMVGSYLQSPNDPPMYPRFPLKELIPLVKEGAFDNLYTGDPSESDRLSELVDQVKTKCQNVSDELCLRRISRESYSSYSPFVWGIKLKDIKLVSPTLYNYYFHKFMTVPFKTQNDVEICDDLGITLESICYEEKIRWYLMNDLQYIKGRYEDSIYLSDFVVPTLYINPFDEEFVYKYGIGIRL